MPALLPSKKGSMVGVTTLLTSINQLFDSLGPSSLVNGQFSCPFEFKVFNWRLNLQSPSVSFAIFCVNFSNKFHRSKEWTTFSLRADQTENLESFKSIGHTTSWNMVFGLWTPPYTPIVSQVSKYDHLLTAQSVITYMHVVSLYTIINL